MMAFRKSRFFVLIIRFIASFFSTNKEVVDSEMEEKESKDNEGDEEAIDKLYKLNFLRYEKKFNIWWLNDYSWMKYDSEKGMLCELCIRFGK